VPCSFNGEFGMKIGLIQIDGKMPNLALLKLSTWYKNKGDDVVYIDLSTLKVDRWFGSKIFMGGSGYDINAKLPDDIECQIPDYNLFKMDYSIGFTSRGCIRDCKFCIVKEKEGNFFDCDFSKDIKHSKYLMMDNNFLASSKWKEKMKYFIDNKIKVSFNQGLDIRLIDNEKAKLLSKVRSYCRKFINKRYYFSFDDPKLETIFKDKIKILLKYIKPQYVMIYILVGYNTSFNEDYKRFEIVRSFNCDPYIMIFNNKRDKKLRNFARWVNKRIYKSDSFKNYER
jgi:hypothetical protein